MSIVEFLKQLTDPESIIQYGGLGLLLFVVFAETGLFIGFFLPGDSLIFISGLICVSKPELLGVDIFVLLLFLSLAAILGNIVGYWFGYKTGPPLFERKDSIIFKKKYLTITQAFYTKNGGKTLIIGRFLPIIRTFAPILAGVIKVDFKKFMLYNVIGAFCWICLLGGAGYYLGTYKWVQTHIGHIVISLIIITLIPIIITYRKEKKNTK
ncbi:MAG: VTT domain-containing protein [Bacteroidetes bacterium]|nr:VTT domain-containing protein [Bacteroidota bacterium]